MQKINLSPSFLIKVYEKGYDYAVGQKLGLFEQPSTEAMNEGRLIHAMIAEALGGEPAKVILSPYDAFRTNEAKAWRDSQPDDIAIVKEQDMERFTAIVHRVLNHPRLVKYFENQAITEKITEKEVNGFNVKGILDLISIVEDAKVVIDWKFVSSQVFDDFGRKALYMHYDLQAAVYDFLEQPSNVYFVTIENQAPYRIKLFHCDPSFLDSGADKFNKAFKILEESKWREPTFDIDEVGELISWSHQNG